MSKLTHRGYYTLTRVTDYGPYVTKLILPVPEPVTQSSLSPDAFSVYLERLDGRGELLMLPKSWMAQDDKEPSQGYIPVTAAYPSDREGNPQPEGCFAALEMAYGPLYQLSSCISAPEGLNVYVNMRYTVTQTKAIGGVTGMTFDHPLGGFAPDSVGWLHGVSQGEEPVSYGYYIPQDVEPGPRPLIVWLHGAGEGGYDVSIPYTANKVVSFTSPRVQKLFGGAYVLAPQAKTFWMNDGSGEYGRSGRSMYSKALMECITQFVDRNPGIDRGRILIGGDSNGGFMTMRMFLDHPDYFAAAFPVCEALYDETITDEDIGRVKDKPIWFTHAKNDPVVKPEETVLATYRRLMEAGAKNVHFTFWDKIEDIHEGFQDAEGKPFEYIGHFAWIPVFNDDCRLDFDGKPVVVDGQEVSLMEWLAKIGA